VRFEDDGPWTSLPSTRKKRRRARKLFPNRATRLATTRAVIRQTKPGRESFTWATLVTFATSSKMPITNGQLPKDGPFRTRLVTFRAPPMFHGKPRHGDVKMVVEENNGTALYFVKCRGFFLQRQQRGTLCCSAVVQSQRAPPNRSHGKITNKAPTCEPRNSCPPHIVNGALLKKWHTSV
jgi:hypothetical protein